MLQIGKLLTETVQSLCLVRVVAPGGIVLCTTTPLKVDQQVAIGLRSSELMAGSVERLHEDLALVRFLRPVALDQLLARQRRGDDGDRLAESVRLELQSQGSIDVHGDRHPVELYDISLAGAKISDLPTLRIGMPLSLFVDGLPECQARIRWRRHGCAGMAFVTRLPFDRLSQWVLTQRPRSDSLSLSVEPVLPHSAPEPLGVEQRISPPLPC
ncbi:PilZ domain-containing protein [Flavisphingomonas formosensis]|uniref:PilZ domain-containing protein n=1 Tax=Flavisphingomonas formosensis TaxID=861534 RepID=UPI0012FC850F|nr:PilZ domain-containing protein [Sphingomonas formosensis]